QFRSATVVRGVADVQEQTAVRAVLRLNPDQVRIGVVDLEETHPRLEPRDLLNPRTTLHPVRTRRAVPSGPAGRAGIAVFLELAKLRTRKLRVVRGPAVCDLDPELNVSVVVQVPAILEEVQLS